ncbi:MAG: response regulator [Pseudomonadota bacterium]|uniref:response regulator n=1 Tax=Halomonas sp. TaxID=1486246 RepID=UPI003970A304
MTMRFDIRRPSRRFPFCFRLALLVQCLLLLAGLLALLMADASGGWLAALLLASTLNLVVAVAVAARQPGGHAEPDAGAPAPQRVPVVAPASDPVVAGDEPLRRRLQHLEADLAQRGQRLERLEAGRDRAREESRLKSDYLTLLGRELQPLTARLESLLTAEDEPLSDPQRRTLGEFRERLGDLAVLLEGIAGEEPMATDPPPARRMSRVLIVDDGPVNLMLARQVLERQGFEVRTATGGAEALACLEQVPFDLVLMDIFMDGMDGMEASRRWRDLEVERHPGHRSVLVALTANASEEDRRRFAEAGLDDYLAKPYRPQQLIAQVRRWLSSHLDADTP